jgi:outer membrane cobalamin receptor
MMILRANAVAFNVARAALPLAALGALAIWGCRPSPGAGVSVAPAAGREIVITEAEIARLSVRTAWDVVRLRAPRFTFAQNAAGQPTRVTIQPTRSVNADETPLLVVDGMQLTDILYLREIPASQVRTIRILESEAAEPLYGLGAAGGAIVVETKRGS